MESQEPGNNNFILLIGLAAVAVVVLVAALMFFGGNDLTPAATPIPSGTPEAQSTPSDHGHAR